MMATVEARIVVPGLHHWEGAKPGREYLAHPHRHLFHITAEVGVDDEDRQVEFHDLAQVLAHEVTSLADHKDGGLYNYGARSCETLARQLFEALRQRRMHARKVSWSEDGEFTATIYGG